MGDIVRIVMLLSNAFRPDPRVAREAKTLVQAGYEVTLVCWDREARHAPHESVHGYRVERVPDVRTVTIWTRCRQAGGSSGACTRAWSTMPTKTIRR
jgi:hypothetical protein